MQIRNQKNYLLALSFLLFSCRVAAETQLSASLDAYSEPVSIHEFTRRWDDSFEGGHHAFLQGRAELSNQNSQREFALLWRYDYLMDFSNDAAEIYNSYKNELSPELQRTYWAKINVKHTSALGFRWSPKFLLSENLSISPGFNILKGQKLTEGSITGQSSFISSGFAGKDFGNTAISVNYHYDHPQLHEQDLDWHPSSPVGYGGSLDLKLEYNPSAESKLSIHLYDIFGRIYWQHVPMTHYDFSYKPSPQSYNLTGALSVDDHFIQRLPLRGTLKADFTIKNHWHSGFNLQANRYVWLGQAYGGYQYNNWVTKLIVEPQSQAIGINIEHPYITLRWLADSLKTNQAHRLGLDASLRIPFGFTE